MIHYNPFTILVDRAERPAFTFQNIYSDKTSEGKGAKLAVPVSRVVLEHGDYTINGYANSVAVERKTIGDFIGSVISRHKWFKGKMEQMNDEVDFPCVVVEATIKEIGDACRTPDKFKTITRTLISWSYRFPKVHWFFCHGRRQAEIHTFRYLERYWRIYVDGSVDL